MPKYTRNENASSLISKGMSQAGVANFIKRLGADITKRVKIADPAIKDSVSMFLNLTAKPLSENGKAKWLVARRNGDTDTYTFSRRAFVPEGQEPTPDSILDSDVFVFEASLKQYQKLRERNFGQWIEKYTETTLKTPQSKFYVALDLANENLVLMQLKKDSGNFEPIQFAANTSAFITADMLESLVGLEVESTLKGINAGTYNDPRWNVESWRKLDSDKRKARLSNWKAQCDARLGNDPIYSAYKAKQEKPKKHGSGTATDSSGKLKV